MNNYKMGNKYLVHRGFEDDGTDKGWAVGVYRGQVYELAGLRFNSNTYRFDIEVQEKRLPILVGEDQIKPYEKPIVFTNPGIQPGEGVGIYRGGFGFPFSKPRGQDAIKASINIPTPIIRNSIKSFGDLKNNRTLNTIINFMIVIGIAVMTIAWAILEAR